MPSTLTNPIFKKHQLGRRFTVMTIFFLSVLLGTLLYTTQTIKNEKSAALLIDMAGRQRMLLQKHLTEVLLTSQGVNADYLSTRNLLQKTLTSLIEGGAVVLDPKTGQTQMVPAVPTEEILVKLREQKTLFRHLITHVDNFLLLSHDQDNLLELVQALRTKNSIVMRIADDAVKELNAHSEANISAMVKWESLITIFVALLGIMITGQGVQASRRLENEMTERERIQNELQKSQLFLHSIVENIPNMIFVKTNEDLRYVLLNKTAEELLDCPRQDLLGKTVYTLVSKEQADFFTAKDREVLASKTLMDTPEEPIHLQSKGLRYIHTKLIPLLDHHGYPHYLLGIGEDITEQKLAEKRLRKSEAKRIEALKQSDALKSAILSSVSHELRTPLTTMKTSVSSILGNGHTDMNDVQHEFLNAVDKEINYMSHLVDNLLDMSQIEAGTLTPHREWHPLEDLLEGALRRIGVTFETRNIEISIPDDLPPAFVDAIEIQQVLINLLDNAMKYSSLNSPIRVNIRKSVQEFEVEVSNTGDPIDTQDLSHIFERFFRQRSTHKLPVRGTGLGLAICKGIIEAHGGRIWAESTCQKITFIFTIPVTESMASFSLEGLHKT